MTKGEKVVNALNLLGVFEKASVSEPMIAMVNDVTVMINGDGNTYILVYSKELEIEGFVQVEFKDNVMSIIDRNKIIPKSQVKTFNDYKKKDRRIGMKMNAI